MREQYTKNLKLFKIPIAQQPLELDIIFTQPYAELVIGKLSVYMFVFLSVTHKRRLK